MKTTYLLFGAAIAVSFGAGWLINKPSEEQLPVTELAKQSKSNQRDQQNDDVNLEQKVPKLPRHSQQKISSKPENPSEETAKDAERQKRRAEFRSQMSSRMVDRQEKQFDAKIANLVAKLGLTPQQEQQLREHYANKIEAYEELMAGGFENMKSIEGMENLAAVIGDEDLDGTMDAILTDEQLESFEALKSSERKNGIESSAMKSMASIQGVVTLDDTQKDAVYEILYSEAEGNADAKSPMSAMMSAFGGGMMMNIDTGVIEKRMVIEADETLSDDQKKTKVEEMQKAHLDEKVSRFDGVLSETQQQQYRQSLESQSQWMRGWGGRRGR